jgi:hypothetical protein
MSRASVPLAGFQVTFNGRFWVTPEVWLSQEGKISESIQFTDGSERHHRGDIRKLAAPLGGHTQ